MIRFAFCDDNEYQRDLLEEIINDYISEKNVSISLSVFSDGDELLEAMDSSGAFDVYLLDIIMPGKNGMKVAEDIRKDDSLGKIIFLTSTKDYVLESYDVKATHYLLKPIDVGKLYSLFDELVKDLSEVKNVAVTIKGKNGLRKIHVSEIMYIDKSDRCLNYHLKDGEIIESACIRSSFAEAVDRFVNGLNFVIISSGVCVNIGAVIMFSPSEIKLINGDRVFPTKSKQQELKRIFS